MEIQILNKPTSKPDNDGIIWQSASIKLKNLKDYENNPRKIGKNEFAQLVQSLKEDGYHQRLLVNSDGTIIGGHARKKALLKAGYNENDDIEVLVPSIPLTDEQFDRVNIRDNLPYGSFDFDMLGNSFDPVKLIEWGMPPDWVGRSHFSLNEETDKIKETKTKTCPYCGEILD